MKHRHGRRRRSRKRRKKIRWRRRRNGKKEREKREGGADGFGGKAESVCMKKLTHVHALNIHKTKHTHTGILTHAPSMPGTHTRLARDATAGPASL